MENSVQFQHEQRKAVVSFLGITDDEYTEAIWKYGQLTAEHQSYNRAEAQRKLECSFYWKWFKNQFAIVDQVFLHTFRNSQHITPVVMIKVWKTHHNPENMVSYPGNEVQRLRKEELA